MTIFTAAALVQMAADDPTDVVGITTGESEYWFFDQGGAGYFSWDGGATPASPPANGWFAVTEAQLDSFVFVQADPVSDFIAVTDENPANSGFLYFPMVLGPDSVPPAPGPIIGIVATDASKNEGNSGSTPFTFTLARSGMTNGTNSITWTVSGGPSPAANAADFTGGSFPTGTVTFGPNETTKIITVNVQGDTVFEPNENFVVSLSSPTNGATIDPQHPSAQGVIINDDAAPPPILSISAASAVKPEGNSGATPFTFTVTRSGDTSGVSSATWSVGGGPSASADGADFVGGRFPTGTVTFASGQTFQTVTVNVQGDTLYEPNENFAVTLSKPAGATIDPQHATAAGVIQNDDAAPAGAVLFISPLDAVKAERAGATIPFTFTVTRLVPGPVAAATVNWQVTAGTGNPIDAAQFFGGTFPSGSVTLPADQFPVVSAGGGMAAQSQVITIPVQGGIDFQSGGVPEQFIVTLSGTSTRGSAYTIDPQDGSASGFVLNYVQPPALNDFNGDGTSDILWQNSNSGAVLMYEMNGTQVIGSASVGGGGSWTIVATGDFNNDGKTDVLWQNGTSGQVLMYEMNGTQVLGQASIGGGGGWNVVATGDFNGDGNADILWQNSNTGSVLMYEMNGTQVVGSASIGGGGGWNVTATGDFNGDGNTDILWQNSNSGAVLMYEMNGTQVAGAATIGGGGGWKVVATADFNGDGSTDILWQNSNTGAVLMYLMNGTQVVGSAGIGGGGGWNVVATGDFNHDGNADILWQNSNSGTVLMYEMNGTQVIGAATIGGGGGWNVVGTGDYNGDGKTDILWQNANSGQVVMYEMNGTQVMAQAAIGGGGGWNPFSDRLTGPSGAGTFAHSA